MYFAAIVYTLAINLSLHQEVEGQEEEAGGAEETVREAGEKPRRRRDDKSSDDTQSMSWSGD